jgi:hypothetical protein
LRCFPSRNSEAELRGKVALEIWRKVYPGLRASVAKIRRVLPTAGQNMEKNYVLVSLWNGAIQLLDELCA